MNIEERIRHIRGDMNQNEFGRRIGLSKHAISGIENGKRTLTERVKNDICREYNVDYDWLTNGKGEPFVDNSDTLSLLIDNVMTGEKETARAVIKALARLGGDEWATLKKVILELASELRE